MESSYSYWITSWFRHSEGLECLLSFACRWEISLQIYVALGGSTHKGLLVMKFCGRWVSSGWGRGVNLRGLGALFLLLHSSEKGGLLSPTPEAPTESSPSRGGTQRNDLLGLPSFSEVEIRVHGEETLCLNHRVEAGLESKSQVTSPGALCPHRSSSLMESSTSIQRRGLLCGRNLYIYFHCSKISLFFHGPPPPSHSST